LDREKKIRLIGANLCGAKFNGASLCWADLSGTDFTNADLSGADIQFTKLYNAKLFNTNLNDAKFQLKDLESVYYTKEDYDFAQSRKIEDKIQRNIANKEYNDRLKREKLDKKMTEWLKAICLIGFAILVIYYFAK
jgi:hypothetical protein